MAGTRKYRQGTTIELSQAPALRAPKVKIKFIIHHPSFIIFHFL
jgi:hypothetical protein